MAVFEKISAPPVAAAAAPETIAPIEKSAQLDVAGKLREKVAEAKTLGPSSALAAEINQLLPGLRTSLPWREAADVLQDLLARKALNGLVDADGRSSRSVAVEQLLGLGFPYALEVSPSDLSHHRIAEKDYGAAAKLILLLTAVGVIAAPAAFMLPELGDKNALLFGLPFAASFSAVTLASLWSVWKHKPASPKARFGRWLLRACGALGISTFIGVWLGAPVPWEAAALPMFWAGAAALAAPMFLRPAQEETPENDGE
ncbi:MAG: hypothetical protein ACJ790_00285 [Myxococcaceae bacterium]